MKGWTQEDIDKFYKAKREDLIDKAHAEQSDLNAAEPLAKPKRKAKVGKGAQQPNKTEAEYAAYGLGLKIDLRFQALTFHMKNGLDYSPDWVEFDCDGLPCRAIEVKGSHRFHSHGRARLAFNQCKVEFPGIEWIWATKTKEGWVLEDE